MRGLLLSTICFGLLLLAVQPAGAQAQSRADTPDIAAACQFRELSRGLVLVDGNLEGYVNPRVFVADATGAVLLAGTPNYLFSGGPEHSGTLEAENGLFGVVLNPGGGAVRVASPVDPARQAGVSAAAREGGGWDVVFAELQAPRRGPDSPPGPADSIVRLWHGVYAQGEWAVVAEIPFPPGVAVDAFETSISSLVRHGSTMAWALGASAPGPQRLVVVFQHREGRWTYDLVPTGSHHYPALAFRGESTLLLTSVRADTSTAGGPSDRNSLFLWARDPEWRMLARIVHGSREGPVHHPVLTRWGEDVMLSWAAETARGVEARSLVGLSSTGANVRLVDGDLASSGGIVSLAMPGGGHTWITRHQAPGAAGPQLRISTLFPGGEEETAVIEHPFLAAFNAAVVPGTDDLLLTGAAASELGRSVVSRVVWLRRQCGGDSS